jgi:hypothetical protein
MRELVNVTVGPEADATVGEKCCDRYAPFQACLLTNPRGQVQGLRFNFSGLVVTVTDTTLLESLRKSYETCERSTLLPQLKQLALDLICHDPALCERLILRAYEAGFADRAHASCCAAFQHEA